MRIAQIIARFALIVAASVSHAQQQAPFDATTAQLARFTVEDGKPGPQRS